MPLKLETNEMCKKKKNDRTEGLDNRFGCDQQNIADEMELQKQYELIIEKLNEQICNLNEQLKKANEIILEKENIIRRLYKETQRKHDQKQILTKELEDQKRQLAAMRNETALFQISSLIDENEKLKKQLAKTIKEFN